MENDTSEKKPNIESAIGEKKSNVESVNEKTIKCRAPGDCSGIKATVILPQGENTIYQCSKCQKTFQLPPTGGFFPF